MTEKILVVEDEVTLNETLVYNLEQQGYLVKAAMDGNEALSIARSFNPDLLVLDIMLPGLDGLEITRILRKESGVPILLLTAQGEEIDRVVGLELGADDYMPKPFSMRELIARVKALRTRGSSKGARLTSNPIKSVDGQGPETYSSAKRCLARSNSTNGKPAQISSLFCS